MPSVLVYQLKAANNRSSMDWKEKLDTSILFHDLRYVFSKTRAECRKTFANLYV